MKAGKSISTSVFFIFVFLLSSFVPLFSADLAVESGGKLKTETATFVEQTTSPAQKGDGTGGRVVYQNDKVYVSDGTGWDAVAGGKTIASRIVGVTRNPAVPALDSRLTNKTADYICDGTDDQAEINAAIDSLVDTSGNKIPGVIYLLEGTYNISGSINFDNTGASGTTDSGKALIGTGAGTVLKQVLEGIDGVIKASNISNILISQLRIDGSGDFGGTNTGMSFSGVTNSKISAVWVENILGGGDQAVIISSSNMNIVCDNHFYNNNNGLSLVGSSNNTIHNNVFYSNGFAVLIYGSMANPPASTNNTVSANTIGGVGSTGIFLQLTTSNVISNNSIDMTTGGATGIKLLAYYLAPSTYYPCDNNIISGNIIKFNNTDTMGQGILIEYAKNNLIHNNIIEEAGNSGVYIWRSSAGSNSIYGNIIYEPNYFGIVLESGIDDNTISSNRIYKAAGGANGKYGVYIVSPESANNYLTGNYIDGAGYVGSGYDRRINDSGTNTKYTGKDKITLEPVTYTVVNGGKIDLSSTGTGPVTYLRLSVNGSADVTLGDPTLPLPGLAAIDDGKALGDLLIIENTSSYSIRVGDESICGSNFEIRGSDNNRTWSKNTTSKFIWNGTAWLELVHADN
ncbi:MAG: right-handed parallel beta-helix repeat-containing protein [Candidatus Omnitrophota bacterium]|nr:right-handed parallel beta-helix repeat-containing protein [Candidatus Omnitrophota bacterium]